MHELEQCVVCGSAENLGMAQLTHVNPDNDTDKLDLWGATELSVCEICFDGMYLFAWVEG